MIEFEPEYFEDEVMDGFYVPSIMKRSWACCLELLFALDSICRTHGLKYALDWGSMIGAVRHRGIIPWDDDIDIVMHRRDLEKLREYAKTEMPEGFEFIDFENTDGVWKFIVSLANTRRMNFDEEYLKSHHNFPYIASIDIFVLDNVTDDVEYENRRKASIKRLLGICELIDTGSIDNVQLRLLLDSASEESGVSIAVGEDDVRTKKNIYAAILSIMTEQNEKKTQRVAQFVPWFVEYDITQEADTYSELVTVPFMGGMVYLPASYEKLLTSKFGDYARIIYGTGVHNYPYFEAQRRELGEDIDYVPKYDFPNAYKPEITIEGSLKEISREYISMLETMARDYAVCISPDILGEMQNVTVEYGGLVEKAYGEGTKIVAQLENFCEILFLLHSGQLQPDELPANVEKVRTVLESEILTSREIVFLPYKSKYWNRLEKIYAKECEDAIEYDKAHGTKTRVLVLHAPLYRKNHLFQLGEKVADAGTYPSDINVIDCDEYNFELRHPDKVYIQNPYDEYNMAVGVEPSVYASAIRPYVDYLVYVPYFRIGDFTEMNQPLEFNMNYFVTMPGVALADKVVLGSKLEADRYIDKLVAVCGEDTRENWLDKVEVEELVTAPAAETQRRKSLIFYISPSPFNYEAMAYMDKLENVFDVFEKSGNLDVKVVFSSEGVIESIRDRNILGRWNRLLERVNGLQFCEAIEDGTDLDNEELANMSDAYYGLPSVHAKNMILKKKPVMIMNIFCC